MPFSHALQRAVDAGCQRDGGPAMPAASVGLAKMQAIAHTSSNGAGLVQALRRADHLSEDAQGWSSHTSSNGEN